jgi:hypothetical protein
VLIHFLDALSEADDEDDGLTIVVLTKFVYVNIFMYVIKFGVLFIFV